MVGTALYVASQTYRAVSGTTNTTWEWGTMVTSFRLIGAIIPNSHSFVKFVLLIRKFLANTARIFFTTEGTEHTEKTI